MTPDQFALARAELGFTQEEIGHVLGTDARTVRRWELGESRVPGPVIAFIHVSVLFVRAKGLKRYRAELLPEKKARR